MRRLLLLLHAQGPQLDVGRLQPRRLQHQVRRRAAGPVRHSKDALQLHPKLSDAEMVTSVDSSSCLLTVYHCVTVCME